MCQHLPTVLTFIIWITDKILQDRYGEEVNKVRSTPTLRRAFCLLDCSTFSLVQAKAEETRQKAMVKASKNDDSESNLSVDSSLLGKKEKRVNVSMDQRIADITRPSVNVLLFLAMCSNIHILEFKVLSATNKWLKVYDDDTREFKMLKRKGLEMSNI